MNTQDVLEVHATSLNTFSSVEILHIPCFGQFGLFGTASSSLPDRDPRNLTSRFPNGTGKSGETLDTPSLLGVSLQGLWDQIVR